MTTTLTLKVPLEMAKKLEALSVRKRISKSKIMRDALNGVLLKEKEEPSMYELMQDAIGCFDSGVTDLATNPKHMEGLGKWRS